MRKLAQIERLIEAEITKLVLPEELGAGPEFKIQAKPKGSFKGKKSGNKRFFKKPKATE